MDAAIVWTRNNYHYRPVNPLRRCRAVADGDGGDGAGGVSYAFGSDCYYSGRVTRRTSYELGGLDNNKKQMLFLFQISLSIFRFYSTCVAIVYKDDLKRFGQKNALLSRLTDIFSLQFFKHL